MNINKIPKRFLRNVVTHKMVITKSDWDNRPEDDKSKWNNNVRKLYEMEEAAISDQLAEGVIEILINTDGLSTRLWCQSTEEWKPVTNFVTTNGTVYKEVELTDPINEKFLTEAMSKFEDHVNNLVSEIEENEWELLVLKADIKKSKEKLAEYQSILES